MKRFLRMQKGVFALLFALCWGMGSAYAYDFSKVCSTGQTLYYNIIDATHRYVELTYPGSSSSNSWNGYTEPTGNITLPSTVTYNGIKYAVKRIGEFTFRGCSGLSGSLSIPSSVTEIGNYAFDGCYHFTGSLTIPNSVTMIGKRAFYDCFGFKGTLTIGSNVTTIGEEAFSLCNGFTGSLTIPNSVTSIGASAFYTCHGFNGSLTLGNSLAAIGGYAFYRCNHLTGSLTIPSSVTTIGSGAFGYCSSFTGMLTIPNSVTSIGLYAFYNCTGITHVYYDAINCADVPPGSQGDHYSPFNGCGGSLSIGYNVLRIPAYMFYECSLFEGSLVIPNSVTVIGEAAFNGCSGFTGSLSLGNSLTTIGHGAFYGCSGLTGSLTIPNSVGMIDHWAFYYCSGFTGSLTIPSSVTSIGICAFEGCSGFTSMTVSPETPPTLGTNAFNNVPKTIPVYVSCASLEDYQSTAGWSDFTNYQCNPVVTVTAVPTEGGTVSGGGTYTSGATVTVAASSNEGYLFMCWSSNGAEVSYNDTYSFTVTDDVVLEAMFMPSDSAIIIGEEPYYSDIFYFPSWSYYNYSMTQQIYTASELEGITTITDISFFNAGAEKTRTYDIYLKHTDKTVFSSNTDWISVTSDDLVCSSTVTMEHGKWTTIELDTPFAYDGISNLVLVMDDNSGDWSNSPHMQCRVFDADGIQAIRVYSDGTNFNPTAPPTSYVSGEYANLSSVKNQIMLNRQMYDITAVSANPSAGTVMGAGQYGQGDLCRLVAITNSGCTFLNWTDDTGTVISTDDEYAFFVTDDKSLTAHFLSSNDVCSLTFNLFDSYGDGWNGNYLVVDFGNGTTQQLTVQSGKNATYTMPVEDGGHVELSWIMGNWTSECSFTLSYENGEVMYIGYNLNESFEYSFDMDCTGQPSEVTYIGDHSTGTNYFLPSFSYYNYSLSEQIYTADEIGNMPGIINGIALYNGGEEAKTRTYVIYLKATEKTEFASQTDWVAASEDDMVFSGSVILAPGKWTPIIFTYPFDYDGVSNLVMIVDDNSGSYTGVPYMACRVFNTQELQALHAYNDNIDYDPYSPSAYNGTLMNVKNQILFDITSACVEPSDLNATDITDYSANLSWEGYQNSYNVRYREAAHIENAVFSEDFEHGMDQWTLIDADGDGYNWWLATEVMGTGYGHHGSNDCVLSQSYYQGTVIYPDNYLVSPQLQLGGTLAFYACAQDDRYAAEHFGVAVSTTGNTNASDFTTIQEWTMTAKSEGSKTGEPRGGNRTQGQWYRYTVDLSAYAGQTGYVAIRHFNCYDQFYIDIDDIAIGTPVAAGSWTNVTATGNTIEIYDLNPGTEYEWQVQGVNCDGQGGNSEWSNMAAFITKPLVTQICTLSQGWNWWSTYVDITLDDLKAALVATGNTAITIKSKDNGNTTYNGIRWRGSLNSLDVAQMYRISVGNACEITLEGMPLHPVEHPVTIVNGANWIGFPLSENRSLSNTFNGFSVSGDVVKSKDNGIASYNGTQWRGTLNTLVPGQGYIYKSNIQGNRIFIFPVNAK